MPVREWPLLSLRPNLPNDRNEGAMLPNICGRSEFQTDRIAYGQASIVSTEMFPCTAFE